MHSLQHIANVSSVLAKGILSHERAARLTHVSIANAEVQARREARRIPGDGSVHSHACLFFDARTPMLYRCIATAGIDELTVVSVCTDALDIPGAVIADGNASKHRTAFWPSPDGLEILDEAKVFATWWNDPDPTVHDENGRLRSAELLVPGVVPPSLIKGFYVGTETARTRVEALAGGLGVMVDPYLFFRSTVPVRGRLRA